MDGLRAGTFSSSLMISPLSSYFKHNYLLIEYYVGNALGGLFTML